MAHLNMYNLHIADLCFNLLIKHTTQTYFKPEFDIVY